jgi:hypothetical protein
MEAYAIILVVSIGLSSFIMLGRPLWRRVRIMWERGMP